MEQIDLEREISILNTAKQTVVDNIKIGDSELLADRFDRIKNGLSIINFDFVNLMDDLFSIKEEMDDFFMLLEDGDGNSSGLSGGKKRRTR